MIPVASEFCKRCVLSYRIVAIVVATLVLASSCGSNTDTSQPATDDLDGAQWTMVSAGGGHSCGLHTDRTITCWGNNFYGQIDVPDGQ